MDQFVKTFAPITKEDPDRDEFFRKQREREKELQKKEMSAKKQKIEEAQRVRAEAEMLQMSLVGAEARNPRDQQKQTLASRAELISHLREQGATRLGVEAALQVEKEIKQKEKKESLQYGVHKLTAEQKQQVFDYIQKLPKFPQVPSDVLNSKKRAGETRKKLPK